MSESPAPLSPVQREPLRYESDEEIRGIFLARRGQRFAKADTPAEKPQQRPPLAVLCILDDGLLDGEWVRLRDDRCVLGRIEGDVCIPHDVLMSGCHAEIARQRTRHGYRWLLTDLRSRNGTWVRVGGSALRHQDELLIGRGRYRFEAGAPAAVEECGLPIPITHAWTAAPFGSLVPSLVELTRNGPGQRRPLTLPEYWIGRDVRSRAIARPEDRFASSRHARLYRDRRGQWHVENHRSMNGLWLRVEEAPLGASCQFRMGEQRVLFRVL